jgi:RNA polymerase sigma-70 factor (ECF subfamily)
VERIDAEHLQQLIDTHGAALALYARQWCHVPEDAVQEALIELLRQEPMPDSPIAWLFKTVRRRAMNLARGERRRAEHQRRASEQRATWFADAADAEFDSEEIEEMLEQLPSLEREIVVARIWGELPFEQIAELVTISSSAAHRRYHKALSLLGEMMNGTFSDNQGMTSTTRE